MSTEEDQTDLPVFQQYIMTPEMVQMLIDGVQARQLNMGPVSPRTVVSNSDNANFAGCRSRFDGETHSDVEAFIDAITVYKECLEISGAHAVKGISMLLTGAAATWWQGIKSTVTSFEEAMEALLHAYGFAKTPSQIYRELFSKEQGEEKTDIFVSKARSLFSRLGHSAISEHIQLHMVYGLLNARIRKKVTRNSVTSFKELIEAARVVEQIAPDLPSSKSPAHQNQQVNHKPRLQCTYCKNFGHAKNVCQKLARANASTSANNTKETVIVSGSSSLSQVRSVTCYGCNAPGYIKSNCPNCSKSKSTSSEHVTTMYSEFFGSAIENTNECKRSLVHVTINNHHGTAYFDSGAQSSLVGAKLRQLLIADGVPFISKKQNMTLADGVTKEVNAEYFTVEVLL